MKEILCGCGRNIHRGFCKFKTDLYEKRTGKKYGWWFGRGKRFAGYKKNENRSPEWLKKMRGLRSELLEAWKHGTTHHVDDADILRRMREMLHNEKRPPQAGAVAVRPWMTLVEVVDGKPVGGATYNESSPYKPDEVVQIRWHGRDLLLRCTGGHPNSRPLTKG